MPEPIIVLAALGLGAVVASGVLGSTATAWLAGAMLLGAGVLLFVPAEISPRIGLAALIGYATVSTLRDLRRRRRATTEGPPGVPR